MSPFPGPRGGPRSLLLWDLFLEPENSNKATTIARFPQRRRSVSATQPALIAILSLWGACNRATRLYNVIRSNVFRAQATQSLSVHSSLRLPFQLVASILPSDCITTTNLQQSYQQRFLNTRLFTSTAITVSSARILSRHNNNDGNDGKRVRLAYLPRVTYSTTPNSDSQFHPNEHPFVHSSGHTSDHRTIISMDSIGFFVTICLSLKKL